MTSDDDDFFGQEGCCHTCENAEPGCLCYYCNCTKCFYYELSYEEKGRCNYYDKDDMDDISDFYIKIFYRSTEKAILCDVSDGINVIKNVWIPKSVLNGNNIESWFVEKNGW